MPTVNREQIAANWASRGFSCDLWTDPPGQRWEDFRHATDELVIVLEGDMEFEIAARVEHPKAGEECDHVICTFPGYQSLYQVAQALENPPYGILEGEGETQVVRLW